MFGQVSFLSKKKLLFQLFSLWGGGGGGGDGSGKSRNNYFSSILYCTPNKSYATLFQS